MYDVYTTEGVILGSTGIGEANKLVTLFTSQFGLIRATAQGIRLQKSKLRFRLVDYSVVLLSLVKGKGRWRLINILEDDAGTYSKDKEMVLFRARIGSLVRRLVHGEEVDSVLFDILARAFSQSTMLHQEQLLPFETLTVLRTLDRLGYIGEKAIVDRYCGNGDVTEELLRSVQDEQKRLIRVINTSLSESQL